MLEGEGVELLLWRSILVDEGNAPIDERDIGEIMTRPDEMSWKKKSNQHDSNQQILAYQNSRTPATEKSTSQ
jgi:hypothetical protein